MGVRLIVEVLDHAPADLTPAQRLALVILAESANDHSRECWPGNDVLMRRTGLGGRSVRRLLTDLADAGIIARVPNGVDKTGAPIYAHRGHATVYKIAPLDPGKAVTGDPLPEEKGGHVRPERGTPVTERGSQVSPLPSFPSRNPQISGSPSSEEAAVIRALQERTGKTITEEHAGLVVRQVLQDRTGVKNRVAYLKGAIDRDQDPYRFLPTPTPPRYRAEAYG